MKEIIIDYENITDSRELLEAKSPRVMVIFIYTVLIMLATALTWTWVGEMDVTVTATGIVRPRAAISIVKNIVEGNVTEVFYKNEDFIKRSGVLYTIDTKPFDIEKESLIVQMKRLTEQKENLDILERSILKKENLFHKSNIEYYNRYLVFAFQREQLHLDYTKARLAFERERQLPKSFVPESKLEILESDYRYAELNRNKFVSENLVRIKTELKQTEEDLLKIEERLKSVNEKLNLCTIKAPIDGRIQAIQNFNRGDFITGGIEVLRIIPENSGFLKVEIMVPNKDMGEIKEGIEVRYRFHSLPYNEYGSLKGTLLKLPGDISADKNMDEAVYIVEGSLDSNIMEDSNGNHASIRIGMVCNANVIVRKRKILFYILEKLNFI